MPVVIMIDDLSFEPDHGEDRLVIRKRAGDEIEIRRDELMVVLRAFGWIK